MSLKASIVILVCAASLVAREAAANSVTWVASGAIEQVFNQGPPVDLTPFAIGTPWSMEWTFDTDALGTYRGDCDGLPMYRYGDAIGATTLRIGDLAYTNTHGTININMGFPSDLCAAGESGPGSTQFEWLGGWTGDAGAPNLNSGHGYGSGYFFINYNDFLTVDGSLPGAPTINPIAPANYGLQWNLATGFGPQGLSRTMDIASAPVPEPATLWLLGSGVSGLLVRRRARSRRLA